jgi:hypothetical protein
MLALNAYAATVSTGDVLFCAVTLLSFMYSPQWYAAFVELSAQYCSLLSPYVIVSVAGASESDMPAVFTIIVCTVVVAAL